MPGTARRTAPAQGTRVVAVLWLTFPAVAADAPGFLQDGTFGYSEAACAGEESDAIEDTLTLTAEGIFGYEFACRFFDFWPGNAEETGIGLQTAIAACGDDSGINRPDLITLIHNFNDMTEEASVTVQSQNEYVSGEAFISHEYVACPTE